MDDAARRIQYRRLLISGIAALADALEKDGRISDVRLGIQCLQAGAESVQSIVREAAEGV